MSVFDHVIHPTPIDAVARRVTFKGEHWDPVRKRGWAGPNDNLSAPPPVADLPRGAPDFSGLRKGRMTAYGRFDDRRWVVRCDCGNYELRKFPKWLKRATVDCCNRCDEAHFVKTGTWLSARFTALKAAD